MSDMNRRDVLKVLGLAPLAASIGVAPAHLERATRAVARLEEIGAPAAPTFFTAHEWPTVRLLADYIIPRDERSGSATEAGVLDYIDFHMSVRETSDEARVQMHGGLRWIDTEARRRFGVGYHQATQAQRHEILDEIAGPMSQVRPEMRHGAIFFANFRNQVGAGFFSSAAGWKDLRYMGNVFNPQWDGCPQPALDKLRVSYDVMKSRVPSQVTG